MWSYCIINKNTLETDLIFGYDFVDACRRAKIEDVWNWEIISKDYED